MTCCLTPSFTGPSIYSGGSTAIPEVPEHDLGGASEETQESAQQDFACPFSNGGGGGGGGGGPGEFNEPIEAWQHVPSNL